MWDGEIAAGRPFANKCMLSAVLILALSEDNCFYLVIYEDEFNAYAQSLKLSIKVAIFPFVP